uniref:Uncharacterized protein n=1 Tax=Anguilla anguilla TaxID=7936 RepID=A0A0E9PEG1_ANGAN
MTKVIDKISPGYIRLLLLLQTECVMQL